MTTTETMSNTIFLLAVFMSYVTFGTAANILALFTIISPSHHIWNSPLVVALANRGHNVTVLSPQAQKKPLPNLTNLVVEGLYEAIEEDFNFEDMSEMSTYEIIHEAFAFVAEGCIHIMNSEAFQQLKNYPPETKFDLIIIESIGAECILGLIPQFGNPPIVVINAFTVPTWMFEYIGSPNLPSYMPYHMETFTNHMTFAERVNNFISTIYTHYHYHYTYLPHMDRIAATTFGSKVPLSHEILRNVSLGMANFHPALDYPCAITPNLIPVAGIQIQDPKPLPADLQSFLDDAVEGAILFSLGSNIKSDKISLKKRNAILDAFAELPQKVLWKFEADHLPGQPKNVKIVKWLPQSDILAHPNVKVFVTHSGLLSTHEAIYRGVPVVGIPFFADQPINIQKIVNHGGGIRLSYRDVTKESLLEVIKKVLHDPSYRENMKALSARIQDDPQTPLDRAVFWTEYVLRHNGAPQLRSAAKDLNIIQYFLLDVIAFLLTLPVLLITVLYCLCCKKKSKDKTKQKIN